MSIGLFVTVEGGEGGGKSTLAKRIAAELESMGFSVYLTREPGGIKVSERIREILLDPKSDGMEPITEALLYAACRTEFVRKVVIPALAECDVVISDRFADSTEAYQGFGRGIDPEIIRALIRFATQGLAPDVTYLLDVEPEEGLRRAKEVVVTRFEQEELAFHVRVRGGFLTIAAREPDRVVVVDAMGPEDVVFRQVLGDLLRRLETHKPKMS